MRDKAYQIRGYTSPDGDTCMNHNEVVVGSKACADRLLVLVPEMTVWDKATVMGIVVEPGKGDVWTKDNDDITDADTGCRTNIYANTPRGSYDLYISRIKVI